MLILLILMGVVFALFVRCTLLLRRETVPEPDDPPFCDSVRESWSGYSNCFEGSTDHPTWVEIRIDLEWEYSDIQVEDFCNLLSGTCRLFTEGRRTSWDFIIFGQVEEEEDGIHYASLWAVDGEIRPTEELVYITIRLLETEDTLSAEISSDEALGFPPGPYTLPRCITL